MDTNFSDTKVELTINKTTADHLFNDASSFRGQCIDAIKNMGKAQLKKMRGKKGIKESDDDNEISEQEALAYFAFEQKHSLRGWFLAPYNPNQLLSMFQGLHLRNGYHLESYQWMDQNGNGCSITFVIPDNRTLPKSPPKKVLNDFLFMSLYGESDTPDNISKWRSMLSKVYYSLVGIVVPSYRSLPKWADMINENYIEGDGSPLSYFQMSMFLREVAELGAIWHCAHWSHHRLISAPEQLPREEWTWHESEPREWCPVVWRDTDQRWNVSFHTLNEMDANLVFHNDTFAKGYGGLETYSKSIAYYLGGYMV